VPAQAGNEAAAPSANGRGRTSKESDDITAKDWRFTMTDEQNHDDLLRVKYPPASYAYAALRREFEPKLISPFGLQYDAKHCAEDWDRSERCDAPFNRDYFHYGPQSEWNSINLGQQIELCEAYFNRRRRLKHVKRHHSGDTARSDHQSQPTIGRRTPSLTSGHC
jgi:hypothetical protein